MRTVNGRYDGYCTGARDLTWSYAAFLTAAEARRRLEEVVYSIGKSRNELILQAEGN